MTSSVQSQSCCRLVACHTMHSGSRGQRMIGGGTCTVMHIKSVMFLNFVCNLRAYNIIFYGFQCFYLRLNIY